MRRTSRSSTRPTSTTPAPCPTTGARTSTRCRTSRRPTARRRATSRTRRSSSRSRSAPRPTPSATRRRATDLAVARKQVYVQSLIAAYRVLGARWADLDPLKRQERPKIPELEPAFYDLTESDMDIVVQRHEHLLHDRRAHDAARDRAGAARDLLRHDRRRVHAHHRSDREALVAAAARVDPLQADASAPRRRCTSSSG